LLNLSRFKDYTAIHEFGKNKEYGKWGSRFQGRKIVNKWYGILTSGDISVMQVSVTLTKYEFDLYCVTSVKVI